MEREQMEAFLAVAGTKSFTRAAESLHVAQTTITARIKSLEEHIGQSLFERSSRHVDLSPAGQVLLPYVQRVREVMQEGEQVTRLHGQFADRLVVGSVMSLWEHLLYPVVRKFKEQHPQTALRISTGHSSDIVRKMLDGMIDVGVVYVPPHVNDIEVVPLSTHTIRLVAHPSLGLGGRAVTSEELYRLPYIHLNWGPPYDGWFAEEIGEQRKAAFYIDHTSLFLKFLLAGEGVGFLLDSIADEMIARGELEALDFRPEKPIPQRGVHVIYPKRKKQAAAVQNWISILNDMVNIVTS